jgi:Zn-dependent protease
VGLALYFSVILHEFGHVIMAQQFGISTKEIVLYPFGGIAFINAAKFKPKSEFFIAIAGPLVNAIIAMLFAAIVALTNSIFAYYIMIINIFMGVFNLIPAYPMDGGRVVRAALSMFVSYEKATNLAVFASLLFASLFIFVGIIYGWISLLVVGIFLVASNFRKISFLLKGWS